jgi:hypothetical protein
MAIESSIQRVTEFTAAEIGKNQAQFQLITDEYGRSISMMDLNVLALAEIMKEVFGQLAQVDAFFKKFHTAVAGVITAHSTMPDDSGRLPVRSTEALNNASLAFNQVFELAERELAAIRDEATRWHKDIMANAFKRVQDRLAAEHAQQKEAEERAVAELKQAEESKKEAMRVEQELLKAEASDRSVGRASGGAGAPFPEGADVFGGR